MKKFLTYVSMQPEASLKRINYASVDNDELDTDMAVYFPISKLVKTYATEGEKIEIVCMIEENNLNAERNKQVLDEEIKSIAKENKFSYDINEIVIPNDETAKTHLSTFFKLINEVADEDKLYVCATFGTKPIPIIEFMALNFAYQTKDDVNVEHVVYGKVNRDTKGDTVSGVLYDISSLFYMTQIVNKMADAKVKEPEKLIAALVVGELED